MESGMDSCMEPGMEPATNTWNQVWNQHGIMYGTRCGIRYGTMCGTRYELMESGVEPGVESNMEPDMNSGMNTWKEVWNQVWNHGITGSLVGRPPYLPAVPLLSQHCQGPSVPCPHPWAHTGHSPTGIPLPPSQGAHQYHPQHELFGRVLFLLLTNSFSCH